MTATGGAAESLGLDGEEFALAGDADLGMILGGKKTELESNGDNSVREIITPQAWQIDNVEVSCDLGINQLEFLQQKAEVRGLYPITVTFPDASVYKGTGKIVGEVKYNTMKATASFGLKGPQKLTRQ